MAEVEIHTGHENSVDGIAQRVGILVGIIGVLLSVVTILGHREHTAAVVHKTEANDQWLFYQAKKIREHDQAIAADLLSALAADPAKVAAQSGKFQQDSERYAKDAAQIQPQAEALDRQSLHAEDRALRFDLSEGLLELGLVMTSLYFLSRRRFFVSFGSIAAVIGTAVGISAFFA